MNEIVILEQLRKRYREEMNAAADNLANGSATDYADYRYRCGVIYGLALAERELLDIKSALEHDADD
jgi:hypothetical protein